MATKPKRMFVLLEVDTTLTTKQAKAAFAELGMSDIDIVQVSCNVAAKITEPAKAE